jgi:chemotaxis protein methyltransferase CheR
LADPDRHGARSSRGTVAALEKRLGETLGLSLRACAPDGVAHRLRYRIEDRAFDGLESYAEYLLYHTGGAAWDELAETLTSNESQIFEEPEDFAPLFEGAIDLARRVRPGARFRCLSAGCGTGEEAYSLAVALAETKSRSPAFDFEVIGVDLSPRALRSARRGGYPAARAATLSEELRSRYFPERDGLCVADPLKPWVRFARRNLCDTDSLLTLGTFDLVFARGFLRSLTPNGRRIALLNLAHALAPGGILLLGPEDTIGGNDLGLLPVAWGYRYAYQMSDPEGAPLPTRQREPQQNLALVAHRSPTVRAWIRILLEQRGLVVVEAAHGIQALERAVVGSPPWLYLIERTLPPRGGPWVEDRLRACSLPAPVAVLVLAPAEPAPAEPTENRGSKKKKGSPRAEPKSLSLPLTLRDLDLALPRKTP